MILYKRKNKNKQELKQPSKNEHKLNVFKEEWEEVITYIILSSLAPG